MRIGVNTRLLLRNRLEGIGWFGYETLKRITENHPEHTFVFFFDRPHASEFIFSKNVEPISLFPPTRHPFLWYLWFEWVLPAALKKNEIDLFLSIDGYLSLNSSVPQISVMHDINFEHYPNDLPFWYRKYYRHFFPQYASVARRIATVSEFSKQDIAARYAVNPEKIDVVYNGVNENYKPLSKEEITKVKQQYTDGEDFFLYIGALQPRKNITRMLQAFDRYKSAGYPGRFVLVGEKKWWGKAGENAFESLQHKNDVYFIGRKSASELCKIIPSAFALIYVSVFEGFGIPILEAMKCGVPVITSNTSSMPEVADQAAILVDPFKIDDIASGMMTLRDQSGLRDSLIEKGLLRSKDFTWKKTAEALWNSVETCIKTMQK